MISYGIPPWAVAEFLQSHRGIVESRPQPAKTTTRPTTCLRVPAASSPPVMRRRRTARVIDHVLFLSDPVLDETTSDASFDSATPPSNTSFDTANVNVTCVFEKFCANKEKRKSSAGRECSAGRESTR
eukprot:m.272356 g.272356  ORF g.272356 m.272356 type:complete len:128 (-) comp57512_c0_seq1:25-408(-)